MKNRRILIVDDDSMTRELLRDLLEDQGHQVLDIADGVEALCIYHQNPIDLVITDIQMPRKNGLELISSDANPIPLSRW